MNSLGIIENSRPMKEENVFKVQFFLNDYFAL